MSIVIISRGSYSHGKEVAEKVAQKLGYRCIAREVLLEASEHYNVPEAKLQEAIQNAPSILDRFVYGKEKYIAYIQAALLRHFKEDNVVYHGMAGHFFVRGIAHVLKVRIIADLEERVRIVMDREKIPREKALKYIEQLDEERRNWSRRLYGIDTRDPSLYDLVLHIRKLSVEDAAEIICHTLKMEHFKTTPESQRAMEDLALAAEVRAILTPLRPDVEVSSTDGVVLIQVRANEAQEAVIVQEMAEALRAVPGIKELKVKVMPITLFEM
ncbi:MAG: cytidylate kinase-like family protein [bacterium]